MWGNTVHSPLPTRMHGITQALTWTAGEPPSSGRRWCKPSWRVSEPRLKWAKCALWSLWNNWSAVTPVLHRCHLVEPRAERGCQMLPYSVLLWLCNCCAWKKMDIKILHWLWTMLLCMMDEDIYLKRLTLTVSGRGRFCLPHDPQLLNVEFLTLTFI